MKKSIVVAASVITMGVAGLGPSVVAHAAANTAKSTATARSQRISRRHPLLLRVRLNQAVRDGAITKAQKSAFESELKALDAQRKTDGITPSSSAAARHAERAKLAAQLKAWADKTGFPLGKLLPRFGT